MFKVILHVSQWKHALCQNWGPREREDTVRDQDFRERGSGPREARSGGLHPGGSLRSPAVVRENMARPKGAGGISGHRFRPLPPQHESCQAERSWAGSAQLQRWQLPLEGQFPEPLQRPRPQDWRDKAAPGLLSSSCEHQGGAPWLPPQAQNPGSPSSLKHRSPQGHPGDAPAHVPPLSMGALTSQPPELGGWSRLGKHNTHPFHPPLGSHQGSESFATKPGRWTPMGCVTLGRPWPSEPVSLSAGRSLPAIPPGWGSDGAAIT